MVGCSLELDSKKKRVELITMGAAYVKDLRQLTDYGGYAVSRQWHSSKHNTGMAMTRALFNGQIKKCAKEFCERDEYNWGKLGDAFNLKASKYYFALHLQGEFYTRN